MQELREKWGEGEVDPGAIMPVYLYMEDVDATFEWLERMPPDAWYNSIPDLAILHDDPRWAAWMDRADPSLEDLAAISFEVRLPR